MNQTVFLSRHCYHPTKKNVQNFYLRFESKKPAGFAKKMTQDGNWEPVSYHDLPDWVKEDSKPQRRVRNTYKTVFYGDPYDYLVQYTVDQGTLTISYWRTPHTFKREKKPAKKIPRPPPRLLFGVLLLVVAAAGVIFLYLFLPSMSFPPPAISPPAITSEVPGVNSTSLPTQTPTSMPIPGPVTDYRQSPKTTTFSYFTDGTMKTMSYTTYGGLADFLSGTSHSYHYDPETGVIIELLENQDQNEFMRLFIDMIRQRSVTDDDQAKIAISLVQRIPSNGIRYSRTATEWYYPYETVHNNKGSAADKAILLAYILNELGFDTVLFEFPNHLAVGVKTSSSHAFSDTEYAFIETTRPTIITYEPDTISGGYTISQNPRIIHLSGGRKALDVSTEYGDAMRMKQLMEMGGNLNQSYRAELSRITDKYDLDYVP
jgi:hypothetical protein